MDDGNYAIDVVKDNTAIGVLELKTTEALKVMADKIFSMFTVTFNHDVPSGHEDKEMPKHGSNGLV